MQLVQLLELQNLDTTLEQLRHKFSTLVERSYLADQEKVLHGHNEAVETAHNRQAELETAMLVFDVRTTEIRRSLERMNKQMKIVIAPREAEALQHEIETLGRETGELDDSGLVLMEESETLDATVAGRTQAIATTQSAIADGKLALKDSEELLKAQGRDAEESRARLAGTIDEKWLSEYEHKRTQRSGIAIAKVHGITCGGCHIELSVSEIDAMKRANEIDKECPNCARWVVL